MSKYQVYHSKFPSITSFITVFRASNYSPSFPDARLLGGIPISHNLRTISSWKVHPSNPVAHTCEGNLGPLSACQRFAGCGIPNMLHFHYVMGIERDRYLNSNWIWSAPIIDKPTLTPHFASLPMADKWLALERPPSRPWKNDLDDSIKKRSQVFPHVGLSGSWKFGMRSVTLPRLLHCMRRLFKSTAQLIISVGSG